MPTQGNQPEPQVDWREFTSLACLLSLRLGGRPSPQAADSVDELDELDGLNNDDTNGSIGTASTDLIRQSKLDDLRKRFLDRLAELLAREKGGTHVASAFMNNESQEARINIWVARNCGFAKSNGRNNTADEVIIDKLKAVLECCSQPGFGKTVLAASLMWRHLAK